MERSGRAAPFVLSLSKIQLQRKTCHRFVHQHISAMGQPGYDQVTRIVAPTIKALVQKAINELLDSTVDCILQASIC